MPRLTLKHPPFDMEEINEIRLCRKTFDLAMTTYLYSSLMEGVLSNTGELQLYYVERVFDLVLADDVFLMTSARFQNTVESKCLEFMTVSKVIRNGRLMTMLKACLEKVEMLRIESGLSLLFGEPDCEKLDLPRRDQYLLAPINNASVKLTFTPA